jgi:hypothetical protein
VAVDAGGDPAQSLHGLLAGEQVFALVASLMPEGARAAGGAEDIPVIGPLMPTPALPESNRFYLMAPVEDQMRVLVDEITGERAGPVRLAAIGPDSSVAHAVADEAVRTGATMVRCTTVDEMTAIDPAPDMIVVLPGIDPAPLLAHLRPPLKDVVVAATAQALPLGEASDERLRLVLAVLPANSNGHDAAPDVPPLAAAAAAVLIEGIKRMGARASRAGLIAAIETLRGFPTGVLPPLSFSPGQHAGNHASIVVRPDKARGLIVLGDWRSPR